MDDVLNHSRQRWRLQLPRGPGVASQTAGSGRVHDDVMAGIRGGGGQAGPEARRGGDWAASRACRSHELRADLPELRADPLSFERTRRSLGALSVTNALDKWIG